MGLACFCTCLPLIVPRAQPARAAGRALAVRGRLPLGARGARTPCRPCTLVKSSDHFMSSQRSRCKACVSACACTRVLSFWGSQRLSAKGRLSMLSLLVAQLASKLRYVWANLRCFFLLRTSWVHLPVVHGYSKLETMVTESGKLAFTL